MSPSVIDHHTQTSDEHSGVEFGGGSPGAGPEDEAEQDEGESHDLSPHDRMRKGVLSITRSGVGP
jgi:hypothetical protein